MLTPFFIVNCRTLYSSFTKCLCVSQNELARSLPAVGNARELHGKQECTLFLVRLEVSSRHSVAVAICSSAADTVTVVGQEVSLIDLGRTFSLLALRWLIYHVTLKAFLEGLFWIRL